MTGTAEDRLTSLGYTLPPASAPVANYVPFTIVGNLLFISGQVSKAADGKLTKGALGRDLDVAAGQAAAREAALNVLAQAKAALGSLDRVAEVVRMTGFVNAAADFKDHPAVVNGASDLMVEVLGDAGRHTRAAVGVSSLPFNTAVEIDAIIRIAD